MAFPLRRVGAAPRLLGRRCLALTTDAAPTERDDGATAEEEATEKPRNRSPPPYRKNSLLPKCAFLFPAQPRRESKRLHLWSLRRSKFSTLSTAAQKKRRTCLWCATPAEGGGYFCARCQKILPVQSDLDLFRVFDLDPSYELDGARLEAKYKQMQLQLHPDRFASRTQQEQDLATAQSSILNKAYQKLKQPLNRAKYLLRLKGFRFDKEQTIDDPELLMEMLELQERVFESEEREELLDVLAETEHRKTELEAALATAFLQQDLDGASKIVTELTYIDRVRQQIKEKL